MTNTSLNDQHPEGNTNTDAHQSDHNVHTEQPDFGVLCHLNAFTSLCYIKAAAQPLMSAESKTFKQSPNKIIMSPEGLFQSD